MSLRLWEKQKENKSLHALDFRVLVVWIITNKSKKGKEALFSYYFQLKLEGDTSLLS